MDPKDFNNPWKANDSRLHPIKCCREPAHKPWVMTIQAAARMVRA
jgi:hypothetical protein